MKRSLMCFCGAVVVVVALLLILATRVPAFEHSVLAVPQVTINGQELPTTVSHVNLNVGPSLMVNCSESEADKTEVKCYLDLGWELRQRLDKLEAHHEADVIQSSSTEKSPNINAVKGSVTIINGEQVK